MAEIHEHADACNRFPPRPKLQRAEHAPSTSTGAAQCLPAGADTAWTAVLDSCRALLAIAVGENPDMDTFEKACHEADRRAAARPRDADLARLRRLLDDDVTLAAASAKLREDRPTPATAVEALMYSLRRGVNELTQPNTQRRLSELNKDQLEAICLRVQAFEPNIAPAWRADDADLLISAWRKFREQR